jgi:hypothetical protein
MKKKPRPTKLVKVPREEFYGEPRVLKLSSEILKRNKKGYNYLYIKDKNFIKFLNLNSDWLDNVGITSEFKKEKKVLILKWDNTI